MINILFIILIGIAGFAQAEYKYNAFSGRFEQVQGPGDRLKYNVMEKEWSYEPKESTSKYNPLEKRFEYSSPNDRLKYNHFQGSWSYEKPDSMLKYNMFEKKWEYEK